MGANKYVLVQSDEKGESNIAVINLAGNLMSKLTTALSEHFDYDISIVEFEQKSEHPLYYEATCSYIDDDDEKCTFKCEISETWVY